MSLYFFDDCDPTKNKSEKIREKSLKKIKKKRRKKRRKKLPDGTKIY